MFDLVRLRQTVLMESPNRVAAIPRRVQYSESHDDENTVMGIQFVPGLSLRWFTQPSQMELYLPSPTIYYEEVSLVLALSWLRIDSWLNFIRMSVGILYEPR